MNFLQISLVDGSKLHRHVGVGHDRVVTRLDGSVASTGLSSSLMSIGSHCWAPGRALVQLPVVAEQHVEIAHVELGRMCRPGAFDAAT